MLCMTDPAAREGLQQTATTREHSASGALSLVNSGSADRRYDRSMVSSPYGAMPQPPAQWPPQGPPPAQKPSRALMIAALAIALVALGVAIGAWFRPATTASAPPAEPQYSEQEVADAKKALCDAYGKTYKAVFAAGEQQSDDPVAKSAIIVNTRLGFATSATFLFRAIEENPAAPTALSEPIRDLSRFYQEMVIAQIALAPNEELEPIYSRMDAADGKIKQECQ